MEEESATEWVERFIQSSGNIRDAYRTAKAWVHNFSNPSDYTRERHDKWQQRVNVIKTRALLEGIQLE